MELEISVIIPTYKPGKYLYECLNSLYKQTLDYSQYELVIVLNGCNEPWKSLIDFWIDGHKELNISFIQTEIPNVSHARNNGIMAAKGKYITFVDDDDYVSSDYLHAMLLAADGKSIVVCDSRAFIEGKVGFKESYSPHIVYQQCSDRNDQNLLHARAIFNGPCMKLIPKSCIHGNFFDIKISHGEDALFIFSISKNIKSLRYASPSAIYYRRYRENSASLSKKRRLYWMKNALILNFRYVSYWLRNPFAYNFLFFASRVLGNIKNLIWHIKINGNINNLT